MSTKFAQLFIKFVIIKLKKSINCYVSAHLWRQWYALTIIQYLEARFIIILY